MLKSMKSLKGFRLRATDGYIGDVRDFHFDSDTWDVKHIYASTVLHLPIHEVLIPRDKLGKIDWVDRSIAVNQTRKEIWHDPGISDAPPLYRRVADKAVSYYLWATHWSPFSGQPEPDPNFQPDEASALRSLNHLIGYRVAARDAEAGRIADFIVDDRSWRVRMTVVEVENGARIRVVLAPVERVTSISFALRSLQLDTEPELLKEAPEYDPVNLRDDQFEESVRAFYEREVTRV